MLDRIDKFLKDGGYSGDPVRMYLAGGMALHFHCQSRFTEDVDASFSHRLLIPSEDLTVPYVREDGVSSSLYFDANYNDTFALMHPDYRDDAPEWEGIGNEQRLIQLHVLSQVDLAVSKVSRFSDQDHEDILRVAAEKQFTADEFKTRAFEALDYYVGNHHWIHITLDRLHREMGEL